MASSQRPRRAAHAAEDQARDAATVERLRQGDVGALDDLYARYAPQLLHLAARLSGSRETGEDVVHDVFVGLMGAVATYREQGNVGGWLRRIVARRAIDQLRAAARRGEIELDSADSADDEGGHVRGDVARRIDIDDAIAALPHALRAVFVLRAVEGYHHAEIATMLGIKTGTSEVRFFRAVRALREALQEIL